MENTKGNLLVSTKSSATERKTMQTVASVIVIILGLFILSLNDFTAQIAKDLLGKASYSWFVDFIIIVAFLVSPCFGLFTTFLASKSYCDVYENAVSGMTGLSISNPKAPMQNFDIAYDEILNVTESGKTIYIYTQYTTYEVLALKNRVEAVNEIRARMTGKK